MRTVVSPLLFLALVCSASAQMTYTTTQDSCGGKALQFCQLPISETPSNGITSFTIDNRNGFGYLYVGPFLSNDQVHGAYSGFVANPDGTRNPFYGAASFLSDDGKLTGSFLFYAYYVSTCSGRGCGGTLGWHYRILTGSTLNTQ
jgi:hypothetical protein